MRKVFFDASVIFSGLYSETGGSYRLVSLAKEKKLIAITSQTVIEELKDNLNKLKMAADRVDDFIVENNFFVREEITEKEIKPLTGLVNIKDAHVVAGALSTNCSYLVTLDKKHLDNPTVAKKIKNLKILSPKKLLKILKV